MSPIRTLKRQLYLTSFCHGLIFWYGIEKLFEASIGLNAQEIVVIGIVAQTAIVAFEIPSSIFADRVSRKKTLIYANLVLALSSFVLGLSNSFWWYVGGTVLWSLSDALFSGVHQAFTYDSLDAIGHKDLYRKMTSRMQAIEMVMLGVVGFAAGLIGSRFGLASVYFMSVVPPFVACMILWLMREPPITRSSEMGMTWFVHLKEGLRMIFKPAIAWASTGAVILIAVLSIWYEYYQLLLIEVGIPAFLFGASIAFLTGGLLAGSLFVNRFKPRLLSVAVVWALFIASNVALPFINHYIGLLLAMFFASVGLKALELYLEVYIQHHVESSQRATAISLANTLGHTFFFGIALVFAAMAGGYSIRTTFLVVSLPLMGYGLITGLRKFKDYLPEYEH